jgi:hypothetical protein
MVDWDDYATDLPSTHNWSAATPDDLRRIQEQRRRINERFPRAERRNTASPFGVHGQAFLKLSRKAVRQGRKRQPASRLAGGSDGYRQLDLWHEARTRAHGGALPVNVESD